MQYHELKLHIQFAQATTLARIGIDTSVDLQCELWLTYIYLDADERRRWKILDCARRQKQPAHYGAWGHKQFAASGRLKNDCDTFDLLETPKAYDYAARRGNPRCQGRGNARLTVTTSYVRDDQQRKTYTRYGRARSFVQRLRKGGSFVTV